VPEGVTELLVAGQSEMRSLSGNPSKHHSFLGVYHICSTWSEAKSAVTKWICHHDTNAGANFKWFQNKVEAGVHETIPENTASLFILVEKFWYGEKREKNECVIRGFETKIGHNVRKTDE
jgi:hypothetical protein